MCRDVKYAFEKYINFLEDFMFLNLTMHSFRECVKTSIRWWMTINEPWRH